MVEGQGSEATGTTVGGQESEATGRGNQGGSRLIRRLFWRRHLLLLG
jgi:hypothetical protein